MKPRWPSAVAVLVFLLVGGCAGSSTAPVKITKPFPSTRFPPDANLPTKSADK